MSPSRRVNGGLHPAHGSFAFRMTDQDGNGWLPQEVTTRLPGQMPPTTTNFVSTSIRLQSSDGLRDSSCMIQVVSYLSIAHTIVQLLASRPSVVMATSRRIRFG